MEQKKATPKKQPKPAVSRVEFEEQTKKYMEEAVLMAKRGGKVIKAVERVAEGITPRTEVVKTFPFPEPRVQPTPQPAPTPQHKQSPPKQTRPAAPELEIIEITPSKVKPQQPKQPVQPQNCAPQANPCPPRRQNCASKPNPCPPKQNQCPPPCPPPCPKPNPCPPKQSYCPPPCPTPTPQPQPEQPAYCPDDEECFHFSPKKNGTGS
ncbi:MAG: hypothetical protein LBN40_02090 [Oscillospiraceae bacterium]|nr:hypothetical protein [Oscillospiraceae bacterium]